MTTEMRGIGWNKVPRPFYPPLSGADLKAGDFFCPLTASYSGNAARNKDNYYYTPFWLGEAMTFDRIGIEVIGAGFAGTKAIMGVYKHTSGFIGDLQFDAGEVAIDGIAVQLAIIDQQLKAGYWWFCVNMEDDADVVLVSLNMNFPSLTDTFIHGYRGFNDAVAYPAPAVLPTTPAVVKGDITNYTPPAVFLRIKSIP